ncbi:MAG TPA: FG-GAP repeat protein, partial [Polyangia bacterium]|nr:FG-GAP repeat protein [Polyangia bacterium]
MQGRLEQNSIFVASNPSNFNEFGDFEPGDRVAAGDLDGDGIPEIVLGKASGTIEIFDQAGNLLSPSALHLGPLPQFLQNG